MAKWLLHRNARAAQQVCLGKILDDWGANSAGGISR